MDPAEFYRRTTMPKSQEDLALEAPLLPDFIGPYKIESLFSKGGMSHLYLAIDPKTRTPLIIKVLSPQYVKNQEMVEQFLKESQIIALTDHPNIVKLFGQGVWENGVYIAMELVQGVSLKQFIVQHSLSYRRSLEILLQVCYALLHLHTHGVIHRDLKPENILITESGGVKVIDFGIAQLISEDKKKKGSALSGMIGTPSYMSPEQKLNPLHVSYASDIFSFGVIAYELIIGRLSYGKIQLSLLEEPIKSFLSQAVAPNSKDRYQDIVDVISTISDILKTLSHQSLHVGREEPNEFIESLDHLHHFLLPEITHHTHDLDIGLAISKTPLSLDLYYDLRKLTSGAYVIILAKTKVSSVESVGCIALLKGILHTLLHPYVFETDTTFEPLAFMSMLNEIIQHESFSLQFDFACLYLDENRNSFSVINCGFDEIWHLAEGKQDPHILSNQNPFLGQETNPSFMQTSDTWNPGDVIVLYTFKEAHHYSHTKETMHKKIHASLLDTLQLSSQHQADDLLQIFSEDLKSSKDTGTHLVLCLERTS